MRSINQLGWWSGWFFLSVALLSPCGTLLWAADPKPSVEEVQSDRFARAKRAAEHSQFRLARELMVQFLNGSVGDRRKGEAETVVKAAFTGEATQLAKAGLTMESSAVWFEYATWLKDGPDAIAARKAGTDVLRTGFDSAMKLHDVDQALAIAAAYATRFPDVSPLCTPERANELRIERLVTGIQKRLAPDLMARYLDEAIANGVSESALLPKGVNSEGIRQAYARLLMDEGQFVRAIGLLERWTTGAEAPAERTKYEVSLSKALLNRAEACVAFGNVEMAEQAVNSAAANAATAASAALKITALRQKLNAMKASVGRDEHALKFGEPLTGAATWQSDGGSYSMDGKVNLEKATVAVAPGFVLTGGNIVIAGGSTLELHGTAERPVVFRKVKIGADLNGKLKAQFALFEDCTFMKEGPWFGYYSSKWIFSDCLLIRSNWKALTGTDYGLQLSGCMLYQCKLPPRLVGDDKVEDKARKYRDEWNHVENNLFAQCEIAPSFTWCTNQCMFAGCHVIGWDSYRSVNELRVNMSVPANGADRFYELLQLRTQDDSTGVVRYVKTPAPPVSVVGKKVAPLFRLAGADPDE